MSTPPETFWKEFSNLKGPCILSTTDADGTPNAIYVGVLRREADRIVIVDSAFSKTRDNLLRGSTCSFLFITGEFKAYQAKCTAEYTEDADALADAKSWMPVTYTPKAVLRLKIESIHAGAELLYSSS